MSYPMVTSQGGYPMVGQNQISTPALPQSSASMVGPSQSPEQQGMPSAEQSAMMGAMQYQNPWVVDSKPGMRGPLDYPM